jgi:predicted transcriptional regulator
MTAVVVPSRGEVRQALSDTGDWLWGVIAGNFDDRPQSTSQIIVAGVISMVPGIDQVMDVRDVLGSLFKMSHESGRTEDNTLELAFTLIGLVPTVGSAGRMGLRLLFDGKTVTRAVAHLNGARYGNALDWLKKMRVDSLKGAAFAACEKALKLLDDIAASLKKANTGIKGYLIPDSIPVKAEALARTARKTWGEVKGRVEQAFKKIQAKLDEVLGTAKKETHPAATTTTNTSAKPQREVKKSTKGLACEGKAAAYMLMMGYDLISVDLDIPQGLDGVFEHDGQNPGRNVTAPVVFDPPSSKPPPYPKFVVLEAKYDGTGKPSGSKKGKLKTTQTGRQGSKEYVQGRRLNRSVGGKGQADVIRSSMGGKGPRSWLFVCMAGVVVMFIDIAKKWPDLYEPTGAKPKRPAGKRRSRR